MKSSNNVNSDTKFQETGTDQHQIETTLKSSPLKETSEKDISAKSSTDIKFFISPSDLLPIPHANRKKGQSRRRGKTVIITKSSYQRELTEILSRAKTLNSVKRKQCKKKYS